MSMLLEIAALGPLRITLNGAPIDNLTSSKAEALLVYLACRGQPQPREVVAELLWPDRARDQALGNLRVALTRLRSVLGPHLLSNRTSVGINPDQDLRLDVTEFEAGVDAYRRIRDDPRRRLSLHDAGQLAQALALYRGEFLEGLYLPGGLGFDEWVLLERERLYLLLIDALQELATLYLNLGDYAAGLEQARRLLRLDPMNEPGHRLLMRLLVGSGQRSAALRQYEICEQILADELGVAPEPATRAVYEQIRDNPASRSPAPHLPATQVALLPSPYRGLYAFGEADADFFFGREAFSRHLLQALQQRRVVAVVGPSGSGKSSAVFAGLVPYLGRSREGQWLVASFRPGNRPFFSLSTAVIDLLEPDASEADRVIEARKLSNALAGSTVSLRDVLYHLLRQRSATTRMLLVVDQFEELYALCPQPEERRRFLDMLLAPFSVSESAVHSPGSPEEQRCRLLITLRADFLEQALTYHPMADALQDGIVVLGPMTRRELQRAVVHPAALLGVGFETGLVERILGDVGMEEGRLPLLQFALTILWEHRRNDLLTHAAYDAIGGVAEALARHAEGV
ncbi:MAG: hypothetical protein D6775_06845, partial [Caldilineae bacterium]